MTVVIAKPDTHRREYSFVQLENGLRAIVGSDPTCDKAGAGLCVNVGMCHERKDLPGLAHFLEHMLFTGSEKYPSEGEYREFIKYNGGRCNAYTTCFLTNYMLEVKPEVLEGALDRFAGFFTSPTLTRSCTDREINAVDSEFQAGLTSPWWRYVGIMNMSSNPEHPWHVAVGNLKVLRDDPKERGLDLYEEMKKLYDECYSANGMTLCVIGKESTQELESMIRSKFGAVINKGVTMPIGDAVSDKPAFLPQDWHRMLLQTPVKDVKEFSLSWVLPYQGLEWRKKPMSYVSHLLGHEGAGSITSVLKQRGWITGCSIAHGAWLQGAFSLMTVDFSLTDEGLSHLQEIGEYVFAYLGMLKRHPVERWIWEELSRIRTIRFKFGEDRRPYDLASAIAASLQTHPPSEALAGSLLLYEYDPEGIRGILDRLTLDTVRVQHSAKCLAERCTERDTSYDSPMAFVPIEAAWLDSWAKALGSQAGPATAANAQDPAANLGLHLPRPNPFVPEDLMVRPLPPEVPALPVRLPVSVGPVATIFHRRDDVFLQPKARMTFHIYSPIITQDPDTYTKVELWCRALTEELNEWSYDAEIAGASYSLGLAAGSLSLTVAGFHDKLGVLLRTVTERMRGLLTVPETTYGIVSDAYGDALRNAAFRTRPIGQCGMRFAELTNRGFSFPVGQRYKVFEAINRESLSGVPTKLFDSCYVEAIALGNTTPEDAQTLASIFSEGLGARAGGFGALPDRAEAALPEGSTLWNLKSTDESDPNHAVRLNIQLPKTTEDHALMQLLVKVLNPKFFDVLRTQQQLGYIVQLSATSNTSFTFLEAQIQSEYPPDYVRSRIGAFLVEHFQCVLETMSEEEFQTCRAGLISEFRTTPKNLSEEAGRYSRAFSDRSFDFALRDRIITYLESDAASLDALRRFLREKMWSAPRLWIQVSKVMAKKDKALPPGAVVPEDPPDLRRWTGYEDTVADFKKTAVWSSLNATLSRL